MCWHDYRVFFPAYTPIIFSTMSGSELDRETLEALLKSMQDALDKARGEVSDLKEKNEMFERERLLSEHFKDKYSQAASSAEKQVRTLTVELRKSEGLLNEALLSNGALQNELDLLRGAEADTSVSELAKHEPDASVSELAKQLGREARKYARMKALYERSERKIRALCTLAVIFFTPYVLSRFISFW
jgi:hypothetical protein